MLLDNHYAAKKGPDLLRPDATGLNTTGDREYWATGDHLLSEKQAHSSEELVQSSLTVTSSEEPRARASRFHAPDRDNARRGERQTGARV